VLEQLLKVDPASAEGRFALAGTWNNRGIVLKRLLGRPSEAAKAYERANALLAQLVEDFPHVPEYRFDWASNFVSQGLLQASLEKRAEAASAFDAAIVQLEKLAARFPQRPDYVSELGNALGCSAGVLPQDPQQVDAARTRYQRAVSCQLAALRVNPKHPF